VASGFQWARPPEALAQAIRDYEKKALVAIRAVAAYEGQAMQDDARRNAPWQDRTGNARGGLFYAVDGLGLPTIVGQVSVETGAGVGNEDVSIESGGDHTLILTLGHTMFYGKYLELSNGAKFAVVMSTIEAHLPMLEKALGDLLRG
jgi:hypothetical protein